MDHLFSEDQENVREATEESVCSFLQVWLMVTLAMLVMNRSFSGLGQVF